MARYITDEDTFRVLSEYYHHRTDIQRMTLSEAISRVPTADVVEVKDIEAWLDDAYKHGYSDCFSDMRKVKHGEWLDNETSYSDDIPQTCTCSVCGKRSSRPIGDFCKWCGADMREDTDNQITVCPMCPDCPDNCPLEADMRKETEDVGKSDTDDNR